MAAFAELYDKAMLGDLVHLREWHDELRQGGETAGELCVRCLWNFAAVGPAPEPSVDELATLSPSDPAAPLAAEQLARLCVLRLDWVGLRAACKWLAAHGSARANALGALWSLYLRLFEGETTEAMVTEAEALGRRAAAEKWAAIAVDAATLRALMQMELGATDDALAIARRAARMAQTEHLWMPHYFASIALARARRLTGNSHLATRIVDACMGVTPAPWHGWLLWERTFAGALDDSSAKDDGGVLGMAAPLVRDWLRGWSSGGKGPDADAFRSRVADSSLHRRDLDAAFVALGIDTAGEGALGAWVRGDVSTPPARLSGLVAASSETQDDPNGGVLAVARCGESGVRMLEYALPEGVHRLPPSPTQKLRVHTLIASLALAGPHGLSREDLFEQTYGFSYRKEAHEGAFRVLRHYASSHLGELGEFQRAEERFVLVAHRPFAVVDPRSIRPLKDIMLRHLARDGGASAKEVADSLGLKLRTVQLALKEMVGEGACASKRDGRRIAYEVEDTTFLPLTMVD